MKIKFCGRKRGVGGKWEVFVGVLCRVGRGMSDFERKSYFLSQLRGQRWRGLGVKRIWWKVGS